MRVVLQLSPVVLCASRYCLSLLGAYGPWYGRVHYMCLVFRYISTCKNVPSSDT